MVFLMLDRFTSLQQLAVDVFCNRLSIICWCLYIVFVFFVQLPLPPAICCSIIHHCFQRVFSVSFYCCLKRSLFDLTSINRNRLIISVSDSVLASMTLILPALATNFLDFQESNWTSHPQDGDPSFLE